LPTKIGLKAIAPQTHTRNKKTISTSQPKPQEHTLTRWRKIAYGHWAHPGQRSHISPTHFNCFWQPLWKQGILHYSCNFTLRLLLGASLKARYLHITVAVGGPFDRKEITHWNCCWAPLKARYYAHYNCCWGPCESKVLTYDNYCWWPLWKQSAYTIQFLLGAPSMKFKIRVITHFIGCWGPFWKQITLNCSCCCRPLWKQSTCTLQFLLGVPLKVEYTYLWSAL